MNLPFGLYVLITKSCRFNGAGSLSVGIAGGNDGWLGGIREIIIGIGGIPRGGGGGWGTEGGDDTFILSSSSSCSISISCVFAVEVVADGGEWGGDVMSISAEKSDILTIVVDVICWKTWKKEFFIYSFHKRNFIEIKLTFRSRRSWRSILAPTISGVVGG